MGGDSALGGADHCFANMAFRAQESIGCGVLANAALSFQA